MKNINKLLLSLILLPALSFILIYNIGIYYNGNVDQETVQNIKLTPAKSMNVVRLPTIVNKVEEPSRGQLLDKYLDSIAQMNYEQNPFDEPRHEIGQQDGLLRSKWLDAYFTKKSKFTFNGDTYYVFRRGPNNKLYPYIPQVCSDFFVDAVDRSFGNNYAASLRHPRKIKGKFSLRDSSKKEGFDPRRLRELVGYIEKHPENYDIVFKGIGPELGDLNHLKIWMQSVDVQLGDFVIVEGKVPWDTKHHSHSFIITKMEDEFVSRISGNAGIAREWGLGVESRRTPNRTVRYIIRLKNSFLKQMYE